MLFIILYRTLCAYIKQEVILIILCIVESLILNVNFSTIVLFCGGHLIWVVETGVSGENQTTYDRKT